MNHNSVRPVTKADRAPIIINCREADTWREVRQCLAKAGYPVIGACEVASAQAARCSRVSLAPPLKMEETEALRALCTSRTHKEAAKSLCIQEKTLDRRLTNVRRKLGVESTPQMIFAACTLGLLR